MSLLLTIEQIGTVAVLTILAGCGALIVWEACRDWWQRVYSSRCPRPWIAWQDAPADERSQCRGRRSHVELGRVARPSIAQSSAGRAAELAAVGAGPVAWRQSP